MTQAPNIYSFQSAPLGILSQNPWPWEHFAGLSSLKYCLSDSWTSKLHSIKTRPSLSENQSHLIPGMGAESVEILIELSNPIALQRFAIPKEVCSAGLLHSYKIWNPNKQSATKTDAARLSRSSAWKQKRWTILTLTPQEFMSTLSQVLLNCNPTDLKMLQRAYSRFKKVIVFWPHPILSVYI